MKARAGSFFVVEVTSKVMEAVNKSDALDSLKVTATRLLRAISLAGLRKLDFTVGESSRPVAQA